MSPIPKTYRLHFSLLIMMFFMMWLVNISVGSVAIPIGETFKFLLHQNLENDTWQTILEGLRFPKSLTVIVVGMGLSVSGLLMQTLFRNPMAGPSVLGISSGASLGVAFFLMGSSWWGISSAGWGMQMSIVLSAIVGALGVLGLILILSYKIKNTLSILIIGLMLSALTSSVISVLSYFTTSQKLQQYIFWGFGNVSNLTYSELAFLYTSVGIGLFIVLFFLKPLNSLLLGENLAQSMGVNIRFTQNTILIIVGVIVGILTAFVGPIAFIGLAVPHIARLIFKTSNHMILFPAVILLGSIVMLICDTLSQLPFSEQVIPINAVTSLIGAPLVILLILKQKNYSI
jgi:iron complex transport system permease protein